jgi:hypothetical protein
MSAFSCAEVFPLILAEKRPAASFKDLIGAIELFIWFIDKSVW